MSRTAPAPRASARSLTADGDLLADQPVAGVLRAPGAGTPPAPPVALVDPPDALLLLVHPVGRFSDWPGGVGLGPIHPACDLVRHPVQARAHVEGDAAELPHPDAEALPEQPGSDEEDLPAPADRELGVEALVERRPDRHAVKGGLVLVIDFTRDVLRRHLEDADIRDPVVALDPSPSRPGSR